MQRRTYSALISATALFVGFGMLSSQASSEPASPDAGALKLHFRSRRIHRARTKTPSRSGPRPGRLRKRPWSSATCGTTTGARELPPG